MNVWWGSVCVCVLCVGGRGRVVDESDRMVSGKELVWTGSVWWVCMDGGDHQQILTTKNIIAKTSKKRTIRFLAGLMTAINCKIYHKTV